MSFLFGVMKYHVFLVKVAVKHTGVVNRMKTEEPRDQQFKKCMSLNLKFANIQNDVIFFISTVFKGIKIIDTK